jgi:hypothetical protein
MDSNCVCGGGLATNSLFSFLMRNSGYIAGMKF